MRRLMILLAVALLSGCDIMWLPPAHRLMMPYLEGPAVPTNTVVATVVSTTSDTITMDVPIMTRLDQKAIIYFGLVRDNLVVRYNSYSGTTFSGCTPDPTTLPLIGKTLTWGEPIKQSSYTVTIRSGDDNLPIQLHYYYTTYAADGVTVVTAETEAHGPVTLTIANPIISAVVKAEGWIDSPPTVLNMAFALQ